QEKVLALARAQGEGRNIAHAVLVLAEVAQELCDVDAAWGYAGEARQHMAALGDRVGLIRALAVRTGTAWRCADRKATWPLRGWGRCVGAGKACTGTPGARPPVADATEYERTVAEGRAALGEAAFVAAWAEGRAMSLEQALEYALGEE